MTVAFRAFPATGVVAIFDEPSSTGDVHDIDAARNAPAKTPTSHLDKIYFHSALDILEVAAAAVVSVSHASVGAGTAASGVTPGTVFSWAGAIATHTLLDITSLGLTSEPFILVAAGGNILWPGMPVQTDTGGRARYCAAYASTTAVTLWESASKTASTLAGTSIDYTVLVFRDPPGDVNDILMGFDPSDGDFQMGRGRFSSLRRYLQIAPGGSPLGLMLTRTIDLNNGAPRGVKADGSTYDPVPAGATALITPGTGVAGPSLAYSGSYSPGAGIQVQAP